MKSNKQTRRVHASDLSQSACAIPTTLLSLEHRNDASACLNSRFLLMRISRIAVVWLHAAVMGYTHFPLFGYCVFSIDLKDFELRILKITNIYDYIWNISSKMRLMKPKAPNYFVEGKSRQLNFFESKPWEFVADRSNWIFLFCCPLIKQCVLNVQCHALQSLEVAASTLYNIIAQLWLETPCGCG